MMALHEVHPRYLISLTFLANGYKQVALLRCQLEERIFINYLF